MTFWCAGFRNVTASYGMEGFTDEHAGAPSRTHGTERVLIAYDRDEAGERGAEKLAAQLMRPGIECFRIQFPKGMDANEYALKVTAGGQKPRPADPQGRMAGQGSKRRRGDDMPVAAAAGCASLQPASG